MRSQISNLKMARRGFTLIELLLVLVILAVLAAVVVPKFTHRSEEAKIAAAKADMAVMEGQLDIYEQDNGKYPSTDEGLMALVSAPPSATNWKGPYLKKLPDKDQWGNAYVYRQPGQHNPNGFDLSSYGPDGREGGDDDITNWSKR